MTTNKSNDPAREALAEEKYRPLKKAMKKSFVLLKESLDSGRWPPKAALEQFLAEARVMISYPGFGDQFYEDFWQGCQALLAAHEEQDLARFRECLELVRARKKECHARYK